MINKDIDIDSFKEYLVAECGLSLNTIKSYIYDINHYVNSDYVNIIEYIKSLNDLNKRSLARKISTFKVYSRFLLSEGLIDKDEATLIPSPKYAVKIPRLIDGIDLKKFLLFVKSKNQKLWVMVLLLYTTGMRVSEMLSLELKNIIYDNMKIRRSFIIKSKGDKERVVVTNNYMVSVLQDYINMLKIKSGYLFASDKSDQGFLTRQGLDKLLKRNTALIGIKPFSAHQLRHTFATSLMSNGANIMVIKELLGHESINTTKIYTHTSQDKIHQEIIENHPLNKGC